MADERFDRELVEKKERRIILPHLGSMIPLYGAIHTVVETTLASFIDLIETIAHLGVSLLQNAKALTIGNVRATLWGLEGTCRPEEESLYYTVEEIESFIERHIQTLTGWKSSVHRSETAARAA